MAERTATAADMREIDAVVARMKPLLAGRRPELQGAILAECLSIWITGHLFPGDPKATGEPCVPFQMMEASLIEGAKKHKRGPAAKAGIIVEAHTPLLYDGPRKPEELWEDERFRIRVSAKVGTSRVMRTRPFFAVWSLEPVVKYLPDLLNGAEVEAFVAAIGLQIGLGDWRPRFGRFTSVMV